MIHKLDLLLNDRKVVLRSLARTSALQKNDVSGNVFFSPALSYRRTWTQHLHSGENRRTETLKKDATTL